MLSTGLHGATPTSQAVCLVLQKGMIYTISIIKLVSTHEVTLIKNTLHNNELCPLTECLAMHLYSAVQCHESKSVSSFKFGN